MVPRTYIRPTCFYNVYILLLNIMIDFVRLYFEHRTSKLLILTLTIIKISAVGIGTCIYIKSSTIWKLYHIHL